MYLGVDQSLRSTGVAVIAGDSRFAYLRTVCPGKLTATPRLVYIRNELQEIIAHYPGIKGAALEGYAYDVGAGRVFELGEVGAIVKLVLHDAQIPFIVVPPASLKRFVAGHGQATKDQMHAAVLKKWSHNLLQDDVCDAYGLAQVARAFTSNVGSTRAELEVLKKLRSPDTKISLVSYPQKD